jgi:hypothetical protein
MYHPMSLDVIRQAVLWAGIPAPKEVRQTWFWESSRGITTTVEVHLPLMKCLRAIDRDQYTRPEDLNKLRYAMADAFCTDIALTEMYAQLRSDVIIARLNCTVLKTGPEY